MLDLLYDLSPHEELSDIDGHLIILVLDHDELSDDCASWFTRRLRELDDYSEFFAAIARRSEFPKFSDMESPSILHYFNGRKLAEANGMDDLVDFFEEFAENNRARR